MFPRNLRKAKPAELGMIVRALSNALASSKGSYLDQHSQNIYSNTLNKLNLKNGGKLQSSNPGGIRTYIAYLEQLGLIFKRPANKKKNIKASIHLTLAGVEIANLKDPVSVMIKQTLRMQFPSPYSQSPQIKIHSSVNVKPAIFLTKMAESIELNNYITSEDAAIAVIYGRTMKDLKTVIAKCLKARIHYRNNKNKNNKTKRIEAIKSILDNPILDVFTPRTKEKNIDERISEILEIGNTLINRLSSTGILLKRIGVLSDYETKILILNQKYKSIISSISNEKIVNLNSYVDKESWQRNLGRCHNKKDIRTNVNCKNYNLTEIAEQFKQDTLHAYNQYGALFDLDSFCKSYSTKMGKSISELRKIVDSVLPNAKGDNERQLIETGSDITRYRDFEINITHYLRNAFSKADVEHIGQKKRLDTTHTNSDFADVMYHSSDHSIIQIDAKALSGKKEYSYPGTDMAKSEAYVKYPEEIFPHEGDRQQCFVIVSPRFKEKAYSRVSKSEKRTKVPFRLVSINELIELVDGAKSNDIKFVADILAH